MSPCTHSRFLTWFISFFSFFLCFYRFSIPLDIILFIGSFVVLANETVEWLYGFDVHCNAFFIYFIITYVVVRQTHLANSYIPHTLHSAFESYSLIPFPPYLHLSLCLFHPPHRLFFFLSVCFFYRLFYSNSSSYPSSCCRTDY